MKKTILVLANHDFTIYNFRKELIISLINRGYNVVLSCPYGEYTDPLIKLGCTHEDISINRHGTNPLEELALLLNYYKLFKKVSPDLILSFTIKPNIYGGIVGNFLNIPHIANITGRGNAQKKKGILQKLTMNLYKISFKEIKTVFFQNENDMNAFRVKGFNESSFRLLPGSGVNLSKFKVLDYPNTPNLEFAFVSRIMKEKGIDEYLEMSKQIKKVYPNFVFHVCGFCEEDYEQTLHNYEKEGIIRYHGLVNDISTILKNVHCIIHPTYYLEGLSNILLEAAASARPIITTNRPGTREVLKDGVNGYFVEERNSDDLILKVTKFIDLDHKKKADMGLSGRKLVEKSFDRNIVNEAYNKEIEKIFNEDGGVNK